MHTKLNGLLAALLLASLSHLAQAASAIAYAPNNRGGYQAYWQYNSADVATAEQYALKACNAAAKKDGHAGKCAVLPGKDGPNHWALFFSDSGGFGYGYAGDQQAALDRGYEECGKQGKCSTKPNGTWFDAGQGSRSIDSNTPSPLSNTNPQPPSGQWEFLGKGEGPKGSAHYVDKSPQQRGGGFVAVWNLIDNKKGLDNGGKSMTVLTECNCKNGDKRLIYGRTYSKNMGAGMLIEDGVIDEQWISPSKGSFGDLVCNSACKNK